MARTSSARWGVLVLVAALAACSKEVGGPVDGAADAHCGSDVTATDPAVCTATGIAPAEEEETVRFGAEADDDDCKYHVTWSSTDVVSGEDVTFTVTVTHKADGKPATGADPNIEVFLDEKHPAPNTPWKVTETSAGTYEIGPIKFDASGRWTTRYHFFETCSDVDEASPHGHVAFFVSVP